MSEIDSLLNVLLPDTDKIDEGVNGRDFLVSVIDQGKEGDLLPGKNPWTTARLRKVPDAGIEKLKNNFLQAEAKLKAEKTCLLYTSPSPRDKRQSRMPSSA